MIPILLQQQPLHRRNHARPDVLKGPGKLFGALHDTAADLGDGKPLAALDLSRVKHEGARAAKAINPNEFETGVRTSVQLEQGLQRMLCPQHHPDFLGHFAHYCRVITFTAVEVAGA